jgi:hypothetical protein
MDVHGQDTMACTHLKKNRSGYPLYSLGSVEKQREETAKGRETGRHCN